LFSDLFLAYASQKKEKKEKSKVYPGHIPPVGQAKKITAQLLPGKEDNPHTAHQKDDQAIHQ
jgi:hypothetical protein